MFVEYEELFQAYLDCRKHKRSSANCQQFEIDATRNLYTLWKELNNGSYKIGRSIAFIIHYPTDREVFAADFRDRIVHHLVINRINDILEKEFIDNSYSCRVGKGTLYGVQSCERLIRKETDNYQKTAYILKGDLKSYFVTIPKDKLYACIEQLVDNRGHFAKADRDYFLGIVKDIVDNCPQDYCIFKQDRSEWDCLPKHKTLLYCDRRYGLPIGNLTSQIFANLYLSEFDHWVMEKLGFTNYGRYVDDFFIISEDKEKLIRAIPLIKEYLKRIGVTLHPKKIYLQDTDKGLMFLGQVVTPFGRFIRRKTFGKLYERLNDFAIYVDWHTRHGVEIDKEKKEYMVSSINSYFGYMRQAKSYRQRKRIAKSETMSRILTFAHFDNEYTKLILNKDKNKRLVQTKKNGQLIAEWHENNI